MEGMKPYLVAFLVHAIYAGMNIISKLVFIGGLNTFVFAFYRMVLATFFLAPWAFHERKRAPPLSFKILAQNFMLAFLGFTLGPLLYFVGLDYTTATVASAIGNSLPAITFFLAVLFSMESFKLQSLAGVIKLVGLILCLSGVATIAFYTGPMLQPSLQHTFYYSVIHYSKDGGSWIKGTTLMVASNIATAMWIILQGKVLMGYPSKLLLIALQCMFAMMQSFIVAITLERDFSRWKLVLGRDVVAITYGAIIVVGLSYYLKTWIIEQKGPVFLASFTPLSLALTIIFSITFLNEAISLGSILGGIQLIECLYMMLWGKIQEQTNLYLPILENRDMHYGEVIRCEILK